MRRARAWSPPPGRASCRGCCQSDRLRDSPGGESSPLLCYAAKEVGPKKRQPLQARALRAARPPDHRPGRTLDRSSARTSRPGFPGPAVLHPASQSGTEHHRQPSPWRDGSSEPENRGARHSVPTAVHRPSQLGVANSTCTGPDGTRSAASSMKGEERCHGEQQDAPDSPR